MNFLIFMATVVVLLMFCLSLLFLLIFLIGSSLFLFVVLMLTQCTCVEIEVFVAVRFFALLFCLVCIFWCLFLYSFYFLKFSLVRFFLKKDCNDANFGISRSDNLYYLCVPELFRFLSDSFYFMRIFNKFIYFTGLLKSANIVWISK